MNFKRHLRISILISMLSLILLSSFSAWAGEGKSEGGADALSAKLEPFTVNLLGFDHYLQINVTLQLAKPEVGEKIKTYMPVVRHVLIILLSNKEADTLRTPDGKKDLIHEIRDEVNKALKMDAKDGVTDTYFENFVIQ